MLCEWTCRKFSLALLLLATVAPAHAQAASSCHATDLSNHFGPIRDQGSIGWCFGYSTADLMGEYLGIKPPEQISAFDVSASFLIPDWRHAREVRSSPEFLERQKRKSDKNYTASSSYIASPEFMNKQFGLEGKWLDDRQSGNGYLAMIAYALQGAYCTEAKLPSQAMVKDAPNDEAFDLEEPESKLLQAKIAKETNTEDNEDNDADAKYASSDFVNGVIDQLEKDAKVENIQSESNCLSTTFGPAPIPLDPKLKKAIVELGLHAVKKQIDKRCDPRIPFTAPNLDNNKFNPAIIRRTLASGRSLELNYRIDPLRNQEGNPGPAGSGDVHSSLIVGMRPGRNGSCEYKIRNSWGNACDVYNKKFVRDCRRGSFWVDEKKLSQISFFTTSLTKPKPTAPALPKVPAKSR